MNVFSHILNTLKRFWLQLFHKQTVKYKVTVLAATEPSISEASVRVHGCKVRKIRIMEHKTTTQDQTTNK